jgi:ribosomal protein S18 acetylase RimI-like enzyme
VAIGTTPEVRRVRRAEVDVLAEVLRRAFEDDPLTRWIWPRYRARPPRRWFRARLRFLLEHEECYTTADLAGAGLWAPPPAWQVSRRELWAWAPSIPSFVPRFPRVMRGFSMMDERHPEEPHFYLAVLGTDPSRQGQGIGSALMRPVLEACDREGVPAYLESTRERNVDFYGRHGFRVSEEIRMPKGPPVWLMWRDPR